MSYRPPSHVLEVIQKLDYEDPLPDGDERYVDTAEARGSDRTFGRLSTRFGWDARSNAFFPPASAHVLFFGHTGSGKSTELNRHAAQLDRSGRYYVVTVDVIAKLDRNNLQYTESLLAMAETLLERLQRDGYEPGEAAIAKIRDWFAKSVSTRETRHELNAEIKTAVQAGGGIPGLLKAIASLTTGFKTGATYKDEWRNELRDRYTDLAAAFNRLLRETEAMLKQRGRAERIVFVVDGTDKLRGDDTKQFFVFDVEQLLAIETLAVYTTPIYMQYEGVLTGKLARLTLPMIKLENEDRTPCAAGLDAMRRLLLLRADRALFASDAEVDRLVQASGGHPRELLLLLALCCEFADDRFDARTVERAIAQLASDYRRFLEPEDYPLLRRIDDNDLHAGYDERLRRLLYRLALMEYNDGGWRRSHPVVRQLDGYRHAGDVRPANDDDPAPTP